MRLIKRYKNRRLYDTKTKKMITIEDLSKMVKKGSEFQVIDNVTKKDITGEILTTILKSEVKSWKDLKDSGKLIRELISKKGAGAAEVFRKTAMASIGAISLDRNRAEEIIDELIRKGELAKANRGDAIKKLLGKADVQSKKVLEQSKHIIEKAGDESKKLFGKAQEQISIGLEKLKAENKREIQQLNNKIDSLEKTIKQLEAKLNK